ncbi:MAG TPA: M20/M25/M40 family metallo-hydrolase [Anaerolineales bacterium]|nr:M20/M25/M40 family metallo-hydrolase [Anaerolineales bacterium]
MKPLIKKLVEAYGPSGHEGQIRDLIRAEIRNLPDYITVDPLGNLIAVIKKNSKRGKKVMLSAHMDEIGVIASHIDENGFVRFQNIGGVRALNCVGGRVRFAGGLVGVIGVDDRRDDAAKIPGLSELYVDVGATSKAACPVTVGDAACFYRPMEEQGSRLIAKSMDDRIGVAILIETLRALKRTPHEVAFVFSVQEEVGLRGAGTAAFGLDADLGIAVDVTRTGDTPNGIKMEVALGGGPAIKVRDSGMLADPRIKNLLVQRAQDARMKHQLEVLEAGTTDAAAMQLARAGLPAGCLSIPTRYIHTPSEMVDFRDVQASVQLLLEVLQKPIEI